MAAEKHKQQVHIDFIYWGTIPDYGQNVRTPLEESLQKATVLLGELEGRVYIAGSGGEAVKLNEQDFCHENITIELEYSSEKPLSNLVNEFILPRIINDYVMPHLNSGKCAVLKNMYPNDYMITRGAQIVSDNAQILEALKDSNINPEFIKTFLGARPTDLP